MRVAITGGTGFVGRHLAGALAGKGHDVILMARGLDDRDRSVLNMPNVRFFPSDLSSVPELSRVFGACGAASLCEGNTCVLNRRE